MEIIRKIDEVVAAVFEVRAEDMYSGVRNKRKVDDAKHFSWFFLMSFFSVDAVTLANTYNTSRRNIYYGCALVRDGVRNHPFYTLYYTEIEKRLNDLGLRTENYMPIRTNVTFTKTIEDAVIPTKTAKGFAIPLLTRTMKENGDIVYGTGLSVNIPLGYVGLLFARNKMRIFKKNSKTPLSVLEPGNSGEIKITFSPSDDDFLRGMEKGKRIAQLVMVQVPIM